MSYSDKKDPQLMEQQTAVMSYLEDLLLEVPEAQEETIPDNVVKVFQEPAPVVKTATQPIQKVEQEQVPVKVTTPAKLVPSEPVKEVPASPSTEVSSVPPVSTQTYPDWVENEFQCLMFQVVGISMAVPLHRLNGVIPWNNELTPMPGHSEAFLGLLRHLDKNVKVMDTAKVILPAQQLKDLGTEDERLNKIILMDEGRWGLACDDVGEVITLRKEEVRWRTASGKRPWLAGTISERLCALLDTEVLSGILSDGK